MLDNDTLALVAMLGGPRTATRMAAVCHGWRDVLTHQEMLPIMVVIHELIDNGLFRRGLVVLGMSCRSKAFDLIIDARAPNAASQSINNEHARRGDAIRMLLSTWSGSIRTLTLLWDGSDKHSNHDDGRCGPLAVVWGGP